MQDYNINLIKESNNLSLKEFKVLLSNLSDKTPLMKVLILRNTDNSKLNAEQRKVKQQYLLKNQKENIDPLKQFTEIFKKEK